MGYTWYSAGSMLIIVALLTMVGIGSNDTYSASVVQCTCTSGTYDSSTGKCVKTTTTTTMCCGKGQACSTYSECSSTSGCTYTGGGAYSCPKTTTSTTACTCPTGTTPNGSGGCVTASSPGGSGTTTTCSAGTYYTGATKKCEPCLSGTTSSAGATSLADCNKSTPACSAGKYKIGGECVTCELGYYCTGDGSKNACPSGTTSSAGASSESDCKSTSGGGNGGNTGGNNGGNGGNTGGSGNNSGSSNVNQNPGTLTKTPLVIALIGMLSVALGTFTYFKGKKEQNNEI